MKDQKFEEIKRQKKAAQQRRRRKNYKNSLDIGEYVNLITGDVTRWPVAYCTHYNGFLTINMTKLHDCPNKNCKCYHEEDVDDYLQININEAKEN